MPTVPSSVNRGSTCSTSGRWLSHYMHGFSHAGARRHTSGQTSRTAAARIECRQQQLVHMSTQRVDGTSASASASAAVSSSSNDCLWSRLDWELLLLLCSMPAGPAAAAEVVKYNASQGDGIVKTMSGVAYIGLLLYFLTRVLNRRARKAREEKLAGQGPIRTIFTQLIEKATEGKDRPEVTPVNAMIGAVQAGAIGYGLFIFSSKVTELISAQDLPAGYTAANIAITVRTIIIGLLYLATFIFSANALGLTALTVQLLLSPDSVLDGNERAANQAAKGPQLPKVTVTSSTDDISRAFDSVAHKPKAAAASNGSSSSSSSDSNSSSAAPVAAVSGSDSAAAGASMDST